MCNTQKIKAAMVEEGYTQAEIAKRIGISLTAFNRKINNKSDFTVSEIKNIKDIMPGIDIRNIFFSDLLF